MNQRPLAGTGHDSPAIGTAIPTASRALVRVEARRAIQREGHALVLRTSSGALTRTEREANPTLVHWLGDLRRQRRHLWGGMLSYIDRLVAKGFPEHVVQIIPELLRQYVSDQFPKRAA